MRPRSAGGTVAPRSKPSSKTAHATNPRSSATDYVRTLLELAAKAQELRDFAAAVRRADLPALWYAFKLTRSFTDPDERTLALEQLAYRLTNWLLTDADQACLAEVRRMERLSRLPDP